jgi:hypothetical protein
MFAALFAAFITYVYLNIKNKVNSENMSTSDYVKPAILNAIMVYFIIHYGVSQPKVPSVPY